jgi:DNA topoisomerase VI subunit B
MVGQLPPKWDEEVIIPMGGDVQNVARVALKNLHSNVSRRPRDIVRVCHMTHAITLINYLSTHKPIRDAFIAQHSITALVRAMDSLSPPPTHDNALECTTLCITSGCICVHHHIFANDGLSGITEAFSSGILPVLMQCADLLDHDDEHYFMLLRNDLPKFIIYPSILRTVKKSLAAFGEDALQRSSKVRSPTSRKAWEAYTRFTESIKGITLIREAGIGHGQEMCHNDAVSLICYVF